MTRHKISDAAIRLMDEEGLEALSMRRLGTRLGVQAMSLYNHVKSKEDLLDAVHGRLLELMTEELRGRPPVSGWDSAARSMTAAFLELLKRHPHAVPLFASRSARAPGSLALFEDAVALLTQAGFTIEEARNAFQTLFALTIGHTIFHYGRRSDSSYSSVEEYAKYPHLAQLGDPATHSADEEFEFGVEVMLEGLRARLTRPRS